jgi:hypothetical protein
VITATVALPVADQEIDSRAMLLRRRMRLRLQRRVLWLRSRWRQDPLQGLPTAVISDQQADLLLAAEDSVAEAAFYGEHRPSREISSAIAALDVQIEQATSGHLHRLVELFGLSPFDEDVLALCLAVELEPGFDRLCAYVQDDASRTFPTGALALALCPGGSPRCFVEHAPLRYFRLVHADGEGPLLGRGLHLADGVLSNLLGDPHPEGRVASLLRPIPAVPALDADAELAAFVAIRLSRHAGNWPTINLIGPHQAGKASLANAASRALGLDLFAIDLPRVGGEQDLEDVCRCLERDAAMMGLAYLLEVDAETARRGVWLSDHLNAPLFIASEDPVVALTAGVAVPVERPSAATQAKLWSILIGRRLAIAQSPFTDVVEQFDLGPAQIFAAAKLASDRAALSSTSTALTNEAIFAACRQVIAWNASGLANLVRPVHRWEDMVLPPDLVAQLRAIVVQAGHRTRVYDQWGFGAKLSRGRGVTALFAGPSGTGKTMAAEVLADELRLDLYRIDLAGVVSKYIGETEKNLKAVFQAARDGGAILFFDEADALFGKRTDVKDSHDRYANIEVNYLLQCMEDYPGLAILATNRKAVLDRAFMRRLRFVLEFPLPDSASRRRMWELVFPARAELKELDYAVLARLELTGGNIRTIALNAAFMAAGEGAPIAMPHVMTAAMREYVKLDRVVTEAEFGPFRGCVA